MFFGSCSAAGLSKRIVQKGTGDGGDSPQGVLDKKKKKTKNGYVFFKYDGI